MADIRGAACLLYVMSGSDYVLLEGQTDTTFEGGTQTVDTYAKDSGAWGSVLPTTLNGSITAQGNLRSSRPIFEIVRQAWLNFQTVAVKIVFDKDATPQQGYTGNMRVTNLQITSPATGVEKYNLGLSPNEDGLTELS
jgi:Phage tail tube protein